MSSCVAVIPARYGAVRLPGKPLLDQTGKPMIQHVVERVRQAHAVDRVIVATDDSRIAAAVRAFGGEVAMTRADHASGTDRVAEVAAGLDADIVLNVQGDEPEMDPQNVDRLAAALRSQPHIAIGTVACPFPPERLAAAAGGPADPNCVKVVTDAHGRALYFSRALIPFPRDTAGRVAPDGRWLLHLGLYGFRRDVLLALSRLPPASLEQIERLEQLRWMENGFAIHVVIGARPSQGIDSPEDYAAFVRRHAREQS